ncbi:hypothetical protein BLEM_0607 [Bifidobacterium lemurum]|uniref:Uncharacterized protein n=1 Tax=Bifidobacterium lemurum TaxID=1603886 RepID=A0A261FU31_9BIFI|nr:hypothetical protein [Bifidobacterium lemurum]OZG62690.1 hypothetical protein BLEM_0607 [Bifidobacterium lemurum]QOL34593.1 hypothetical protein BL8807_01265 [Bifidobacterium lemurum]
MAKTRPMTITMDDGTEHKVPITAFAQMKAEDKAQREGWAGGFQSLRATMYAAYWMLRSRHQVTDGFERWASHVDGIAAPAPDDDTDANDDGEDDDPKS